LLLQVHLLLLIHLLLLHDLILEGRPRGGRTALGGLRAALPRHRSSNLSIRLPAARRLCPHCRTTTVLPRTRTSTDVHRRPRASRNDRSLLQTSRLAHGRPLQCHWRKPTDLLVPDSKKKSDSRHPLCLPLLSSHGLRPAGQLAIPGASPRSAQYPKSLPCRVRVPRASA